MNNDLMFSSNDHCWGTPQKIFDKYNDIYNFNLDAAANEYNHKCPAYFDPFTPCGKDGLKEKWSGTVWLNPPYGRGVIDKWVEKAFNAGGRSCIVVALLPARTDTRWFHDYIYNQPSVKLSLLKGRLKFEDYSRTAKSPAPFPSMIVIFGEV